MVKTALFSGNHFFLPALALCLIMVLGVSSFGKDAWASENDLAYKHLLRAGDLKKDGDFAGALKEYQAAWKLAELPEALLAMARILDFYFNKNLKAVKLYRIYLKKFPNSRDAYKVKKEIKKAKNQLRIEEDWHIDIQEMEEIPLQALVPLPAHVKKKQIVLDEKAEEALQLAAETFTGLPSTCLGCHAGVMGPKINMDATHPVGRIPTGKMDETVPLDVRFYREGRVICLSCHNPKIIHISSRNPEKVYKVLRVDTGEGGENLVLFCGMCHGRKVSPDSFRRMGIGDSSDDEVALEIGINRENDEFEEDDEEVSEDFFSEELDIDE